MTPLRRSGEGIESFYCDIGGVLPVTTACPLDGVGGGATSDTVPMSTRQRVANITNEASNSTDDDASKSNGAFSSSDASNSNNARCAETSFPKQEIVVSVLVLEQVKQE